MDALIHPYYFSSRKRILDITLACILLVGLLPVLTGIALVILITSGWPAIFSQQRVGKDKKIFTMYKFRTMYVGAHKDQKKYAKLNESPFPAFKLTNDPRFVGIGKWLSKTGLDELPQLINILKGEMSFIGPRPLPISEAKKLTGSWDFRYQVKPGVLSLWALSDKRHKSLRNWQSLEKKTFLKGSISHELSLISEALKIPFL
jgi:lipopolysaccharide/colanic/teichoic acid biosynthesis glycosyltransferase